MIALFIPIYLVSLVIHLVLCYKENKRHIFYMRDLLEEIEFHMWFPVTNTKSRKLIGEGLKNALLSHRESLVRFLQGNYHAICDLNSLDGWRGEIDRDIDYIYYLPISKLKI